MRRRTQKSPLVNKGTRLVHSVKSASAKTKTLKDVYELAYFIRFEESCAKVFTNSLANLAAKFGAGSYALIKNFPEVQA